MRVRDLTMRLLDRREWVYLLSLLVPLFAYDLALKVVGLASGHSGVGVWDALGLLRSELLFDAGYALVLGYSPDFETTPLDEVVWTSNVAGFIGYGHEVITETLAPGLHKITLSVTDGIGGEASDDVLIKINPKQDAAET